MRSNIKIITLAFLALLLPIAALAADAAAPTAPAAPSGEWFTADFLRTVFSVAIGGLISGAVALGLAILNNKNAIKLNQQRIEADKEKLKQEFEFKQQEQNELIKRQQQLEFYKEREKQCKFLIDMFNPSKIIRMSKDIEGTSAFMTALLYTPGKPYTLYVSRIINFVRYNPCGKEVALYFDGKNKFMTEEQVIFWAKLNIYCSSLALATRKILHNEEIKPPKEDVDFEDEIFKLTYSEM